MFISFQGQWVSMSKSIGRAADVMGRSRGGVKPGANAAVARVIKDAPNQGGTGRRGRGGRAGRSSSKSPKPSGPKKSGEVVLFLNKADFAGVASRLAVAINRHTKWRAYCITPKPVLYDVGRGGVIRVNNRNRERIRQLMVSADAVIWTSSFYNYKPFGLPVNPKARTGIWHGGTMYRRNFAYFNRKVHPKLDLVYAHRDLEGLYKKTIRLHAPFDTKKYTPIERGYHPVVVAHSPSSRKMKGTAEFLAAMKQVRKNNDNVDVVLIEKVRNDVALGMKQKAHVFFDQMNGYAIPVKYGASHGYGVSLIEAASFGCAVLGWSNYKDTPIMCVRTKKDIARKVDALVSDRNLLRTKMRAARQWVVKEHDYAPVAKRFVGTL